jgi:isoquinoline 1-oxidoreductase alpha subunit
VALTRGRKLGPHRAKQFLHEQAGPENRGGFHLPVICIRKLPVEAFFMVTLTVNGVRCEVQAPDDTPLLYVLRNDLQLMGPQFGCGLAQCGACAVLIDGKEVRSCVTPVASIADQEVTTLEGLPARWAKQKGLSAEEAKGTLHPVQQAWIEEQTPQCGFCQNGMMIKATELLESNPSPTLAQIKEAFTTSGPSPNLCRCGTYVAIIEAVQHAATIMANRS